MTMLACHEAGLAADVQRLVEDATRRLARLAQLARLGRVSGQWSVVRVQGWGQGQARVRVGVRVGARLGLGLG